MYPVKEVILPVVLNDSFVSLRVITDIFGYGAFVGLNSGLLIMTAPAHVEVAREVAISDGFEICTDATGQKSLDLIIDNAKVLVGATIDPDLDKSAEVESGVAISAYIRCTARRYKKIADLGGLTLADVSGWNLADIYYMEV